MNTFLFLICLRVSRQRAASPVLQFKILNSNNNNLCPRLESLEMMDRPFCLEDVQIFYWEPRSKKEYIMNGLLL